MTRLRSGLLASTALSGPTAGQLLELAGAIRFHRVNDEWRRMSTRSSSVLAPRKPNPAEWMDICLSSEARALVDDDTLRRFDDQ